MPVPMPAAVPAAVRRALWGAALWLIPLTVIATLAAGAYLRTAPAREERRLRALSLAQLAAEARRRPDSPRVLYHLGLHLLGLGQPDAAAGCFERSVGLNPEDERVWLAWAGAAEAAGRRKQAYGILSTLTRRRPDSAGALSALAELDQKAGRDGRAFAEATAATRRDSQDARAWRTAARAATRLGRLDEAEIALRGALGCRVGDWRTKVALGDLLLRRGRVGPGVQSYREAAQIAPREAVAQLALGRALLSTGGTPAQWEEARQSLRRGAALEPTWRVAWELLASCLEAQGRAGEARAARARASLLPPTDRAQMAARMRPPAPDALGTPEAALLSDAAALLAARQYPAAELAYRSLLGRDPASAPAFEGLGLSLNAQGKDAGAFLALQKAVALDPSLARAQSALARQYFKQGFWLEAYERMSRLVRQAPGGAQDWYALGLAARSSRRPAAEVEDAFRHAAALEPRNLLYLLNYADAQAQNQHAPEAEADLRRALAMQPDNPDAQMRLGWLLAMHAPTPPQQVEARALLGRALKTLPGNPYALLCLGRLDLDGGRPAQAAADLRQAVRSDPAVADAWYALGRALRRTGDVRGAAEAEARSQRLRAGRRELIHAEELAALAPQDVPLQLKLARLNARQGDWAQALNIYQVCRQMAPGDAQIRAELDGLTRRLAAEGRLPDMATFDAMAAVNARRRSGGTGLH